MNAIVFKEKCKEIFTFDKVSFEDEINNELAKSKFKAIVRVTSFAQMLFKKLIVLNYFSL
jgi:hypothetical protein